MANETLTTRVSGKALTSFLLGLTAPFLLVFTGVPALVLGVVGLRDINRSDGRLTGLRLALAGMVLGAVGILVTVVGAFCIVILQARATAARAECANHLRELGMAVNDYYQVHKAFPAGTLPNDQLSPDQRLSWFAGLLPYYAEREALRRQLSREQSFYGAIYRNLDLSAAWDAESNRQAINTPVRVWLCPGHPHYDPRQQPGQTHYVGLAGIGSDAAALPLRDPRAGVFGSTRQASRDDFVAGTSQTILVAETAWQNGPWAAGGFPTVRGLDPGDRPFFGVGRPFGGMHPGGLNVLMADGAVPFFSNKMGPRVFMQHLTIHGDKALLDNGP